MATKKSVLKAFVGDDIMVDLETLDTEVTSAIISIGACRFNIDEIDEANTFYRVINIQSNIDEGRTISGDTLKFWMGQGENARNLFKDPDAVPLSQALDEFRAWIGPNNANVRMWANSPDFDCSILKHAYRYGNQSPPWSYYNVRCVRTMRALAGMKDIASPQPAIAHHALYDAVAQAQNIQLIWKAQASK